MRLYHISYLIPLVLGLTQVSCTNIEIPISSLEQQNHKPKLASRLANAFWVYDDPITRHSIVFELAEHSSNKGYYLYREWKYDCNQPEQPLYYQSGIPSSEDNGVFAEFYIPSHHRGYQAFLKKTLSERLHLVKLKPKKEVILLKKTGQESKHYTFYYQKENKARCQFK